MPSTFFPFQVKPEANTQVLKSFSTIAGYNNSKVNRDDRRQLRYFAYTQYTKNWGKFC